jgi:hypothetical protein
MRSIHPLILLAAASGCAGHRGAPLEVSCAPIADQRLPPGTTAAALEGEFTLTLVSAAGSVAKGVVALRANDSALVPLSAPGGSPRPDATMPLVGTAAIDLESVGAVRMGDLGSQDPTAPGVAVLERHEVISGDTTASEITVRLGSEANRRDMIRFDGGYTALFVQAVTEAGFGGAWVSGGGRREASGHFCAVR